MLSKKILMVALVVLISIPAYSQNNFRKIKSKYNVSGTAEKLIAALTAKGMTVFATIDHQQGAEKAGMQLRPTTLIIFGNPKVGTKLMQCDQRAGLALPLKMLIWEDESGGTWLGYWLPESMVSRYELDACNEVLLKVKNAMANFAKAATS